MHTPIIIEDVLHRRSFASAQVLTDTAGRNRTVRWVHVLEDDNPQQLLHGGELVLTTGIGLKGSTLSLESFVLELVRGKAAGLCVELGGAIRTMPQTVIDTAKIHDFPLIIFPHQVRFVDITQDIHGLILSRHHRILDDLEELNQHLNEYVFGGFQPKKILELLADTTQSHVIYQLNNEQPQVSLYPRNILSQRVMRDWRKLYNLINVTPSTRLTAIESSYKSLRKLGNLILSQQVVVLGAVRGTLHLLWESSDCKTDEFRSLALDRAASTLAHDEFRRMSVQERQLFYEQDYVERLLAGTNPAPSSAVDSSITDSSGRTHISDNSQPGTNRILTANDTSAVSGVGIGRYPGSVYHAVLISANLTVPRRVEEFDWVSQRIDIAMSARLAFTRQHLECALSVRRQAIVGIIAHQKNASWREQLKMAVRHLSDTLFQFSNSQTEISVYVGERADSLSRIYQSYQRAEGMANHSFPAVFDHSFSNKGSSRLVFYDDTGVYKWLALMENHPDRKNLVQGEIGQLREYDQGHKTDLVGTLKTYLDCDRSVQRTASRLSIHRQTMYHRLQQIQSILKNKLDNPPDRLSMHLALYIYHYDDPTAAD